MLALLSLWRAYWKIEQGEAQKIFEVVQNFWRWFGFSSRLLFIPSSPNNRKIFLGFDFSFKNRENNYLNSIRPKKTILELLFLTSNGTRWIVAWRRRHLFALTRSYSQHALLCWVFFWALACTWPGKHIRLTDLYHYLKILSLTTPIPHCKSTLPTFLGCCYQVPTLISFFE